MVKYNLLEQITIFFIIFTYGVSVEARRRWNATFVQPHQDIWVAKIIGGRDVAQLVAASHGYSLIAQSNLAEDIYIVEKGPFSEIQKRNGWQLASDPKVMWAEHQVAKVRSKRGIFSWLRSRYTRVFNDKLWPKEWYMQDYRRTSRAPVLDLNAVPCYAEGITGAGVRVVVVDDGLEKDHADIWPNFEPEISIDLNEGDFDPTPRYDSFGSNSHGTKCAGEIAMVANNQICGVGIAYNASIGGIKLLDGPTTDMMEAEALNHALDLIDVYSNSWGPTDDGKTLEGPGKLTLMALEKGAREGRQGKGAIYVFASGNGKHLGDNCGADGYINSIYTIPIASANQEGKAVFYGDRCSAIMATAYSSGGPRNEMIATTDLNNTCTLKFAGTSAAAPLAAGIMTLLLQANPDLTWRDVQHLIAWTSQVAPLSGNPDWVKNGAGFWVSPDFGFGLLNAHSLVQHSRGFPTVPKQRFCHVPVKLRGHKNLTRGSEVNVRFVTTGCEGMKYSINYLEHVQLTLSLKYPRRGSISIFITSPSGTRSTVMEERFRDEATIGLRGWKMVSVHFWGENPAGLWTVTVKTREKENEESDWITWEGNIRSVSLTLYGSGLIPEHYRNGPRSYYPFNLGEYSYGGFS